MPAATHMAIAGVNLALRCRHLPVLPDPWPCYQPFLGAVNRDPAAVSITLDIELEGMPDVGGMERLFDGEAWSLFRDGDGFCFALQPRASGANPMWVTCVDRFFTSGRVFCDPALVQDNGGVKGLVNPILHRLDQLLLMYVLGSRHGILVHAAGAVIGGRAFLFAGRSGAGKTTITRLFQAAGGSDTILLSDDRMIVRKESGSWLAYGTPWAGDAQVAANRSAPFGGVFFLRHADDNRAIDLVPAAALEHLLPLVSVPWYDPALVEQITDTCGAVAQAVPARELCFRPDESVVECVRAAVGV